MQGPLGHITVLDLTIARAGPAAVRLLSDWGANVIKVERPPRGGQRSATGSRWGSDEQNLHRNKRSLALDLKAEEGQKTFYRLVASADVVVENFRSDVKFRLGIDYERLKTINPSLIYASISGFGQQGPYASRPGVDQIVQGMSGLMSITGMPDQGPTRVGIAISDTSAGMFLGQGILLALLHRERTGEGQWVHTSLLESMMSKLDFQAARYTMDGEVAQPQGNDHPTQVPMGTYTALDGLVNLAAFGDVMWQRFCEALEADHLLHHKDYQSVGSRLRHRDQLKQDMESVTSQFCVTDLIEKLNAHGVPCGPINTIGEAFEDEQVQFLQMAKPANHTHLGEVGLVRSPLNLSAFPQASGFDRPGPDVGEHSQEVLLEMGFTEDQVRQLELDQVIAQAQPGKTEESDT